MNFPEFRLYYDENGSVLFYTCEKPEGNYIVIDNETYLACRYDVKVVDNKIVSMYNKSIITKLVPSDDGISCYEGDISIIHDGTNSQKWKLKHVEHN